MIWMVRYHLDTVFENVSQVKPLTFNTFFSLLFLNGRNIDEQQSLISSTNAKSLREAWLRGTKVVIATEK